MKISKKKKKTFSDTYARGTSNGLILSIGLVRISFLFYFVSIISK